MRARKEGRGKALVFDPLAADAALAKAFAQAETSLAALRKVAEGGRARARDETEDDAGTDAAA